MNRRDDPDQFSLFGVDTLAAAKRRVQEAIESGEQIDCECCEQVVKKYPRRVYRKVLLGLWEIARSEDGLLAHEIIGNLARRGYHMSGNDHCKLAYWGLAVLGSDGRWRATALGRDFLNGEVRIAKYAHVYNGIVRRYSEETVDLSEIAKEFNLAELLDPENLWK